LDGNVNGDPEGVKDGTLEGTGNNPEGERENQSENGTGEQTEATNPSQQGNEGQSRQAGDPRTNWLDTAPRWTGYLNLEFGGNEGGGEAGGVPGGLDLFGWRPPMWVRRTLQVVYIATTVVTTIIPIGKLALAAKVAIQGALKIGLKAAATKLLTALAAKIPTKAAMAAGASKLGHVVAGVPMLLGAILKTNPKSLLRPTQELLERVSRNPNALRVVGNEVHNLGNIFGETVAVTRAALKNGDDLFFAAINSGARPLNIAQRQALERLGINIVPQYFRRIPIMRKIYHAEVNMIHHLGDAPLSSLRWGISMVGNKASHLCGDCLRRIRMFDSQMGITSTIENLLH
jgi:hypothetical protein